VDESEEDDGVIRVEIGGETSEEKAKRVAMALRKYVVQVALADGTGSP
jgi:hypothetical protein